MKEKYEVEEQNQNKSKEIKEIKRVEIKIQKPTQSGEITKKESIDFQFNQERALEQSKQTLLEIKHLAKQGSHITGYLELPVQQINKYKKKTQKDAVIDEILLDKFLPPNSVTPLIFTKKLPTGGSYRQKGSQPIWVNAFESILSVVVQLYYKSDQKLADFIKEKSAIESKRDIKQEKKPGRKKKNLENESPNPEQNEQVQSISPYSTLQQDVLDVLISPLRDEFPFEQWTPKEIAIFECGLCRFGKQYEFISQLIRTKNAQDIIQFYYFWKFTSHYKLWKNNKAYYHRSNLNNFV